MIKSCCDETHLLPMNEALQRMIEQVHPLTEVETLTLSQALDRVLAQPVTATLNVPAHANSAMDGYALRAADSGEPLQLIGTSLAGHPFEGELTPGTCVRIMTGALIPAGADCVVMQENTQIQGETVTLTQEVRSGENIRQCGEDIAKGDQVLDKGKRLGPVDIGLLASLGINQVPVYRRLRVAVLSTGDELTPPGQPLPAGNIYDSNRYAIIALLQRLAVEVIDLGLIPDQPDAIRNAFIDAVDHADAVISSGGVSVGDADFVKDILAELGQIAFWKVAIKPGKPFAFGSLGQARFFGLPGNPVSALVTLHQLALPILKYMAGEVSESPLTLNIKAASAFRKRPGRADYQRACLSDINGENQVASNRAQGSGILTSFTHANCYVALEQERGKVAEGEIVRVIPFDRFLI